MVVRQLCHTTYSVSSADDNDDDDDDDDDDDFIYTILICITRLLE